MGAQLIDEPHRSHALALCATDRRCARRHHPVRAVFHHRRSACSISTGSAMPASRTSPNCRRASAPMPSPAWKRTRLIVQWVQQCLERRISSYHWALERLVIQAPDNMAADADRLIGELAALTANPPVAAQPVHRSASERRAADAILRLGFDQRLIARRLGLLGRLTVRSAPCSSMRRATPGPAASGRAPPPAPSTRSVRSWLANR